MDLEDQSISWNDFYNAYTGLKFTIHNSEDCRIFIPTYRNLKNVVTTETSGVSGTEMAFQDEWSSQTLLIDGSSETIDSVFLKNLWDYAESNILWDDFLQILSFKDVNVEETTLLDFVKGIDQFLVYHKLSRFGDVWWSSRVTTEGFQDNNEINNVALSNTLGGSGADRIINMWSPDKYLNDEYKNYNNNPGSYDGFLISDDFKNGGWFTLPNLTISSKPFEKLKMADILFNLNFTFDPEDNFGHYYKLTTDIGARIKDETTSTVLDETLHKNYTNEKIYSDTLVSRWTGGLISYNNINELSEIGNYLENSCTQKQNEIEHNTDETNSNAISHKLSSQISLYPNFDNDNINDLGTIDPINWKSSDQEDNVHEFGLLNISRAFGGASGNRTNGIVTGGISTDFDEDNVIKVLSNTEIWENDGFLKNTLISLNTSRCYHVQGGTGSESCAVIGGYESFENDDYNQFSYFSKDGVLNSTEVYVSNIDYDLSYFKKIQDVQLNVPRGDHAGYLNVTTESRQDKFDVDSTIKNYNVIEDDEQSVMEFVEDKSQVQSNYVRYSLSNINGFVYGGSLSGNSNLITQAIEYYSEINGTYYDEVTNVFERITSTNIISSENELTTTELESPIIINTPEEIVSDVVIIDGFSSDGKTVNLEKCGKYRIQYIDGYYEIGADIEDISGSDNIKEVVEESFSIPGWDEFGPTLQLTNSGYYRLDIVQSGVITGGLPDEEENPAFPKSVSVDASTSGESFVVDVCGKYRVQYSSGYFAKETGGFENNVVYSAGFRILSDGNEIGTFWDECYTSKSNFNLVYDPTVGQNRYFEFCVDSLTSSTSAASVSGQQIFNPQIITIEPLEDPCSSYSGTLSGTVNLNVTYLGSNECSCATPIQVEVIENDNLNSIAFTSSTIHTFCVKNKNSELRLRYKDENYEDNFDKYGSIVVKISYLGDYSQCNGGIDNIYTTALEIYNNDNFISNTFVSEKDTPDGIFQDYLLNSKKQVYDFCTTDPNSTLTIRGNLNNRYDGMGTVKVKVLYLGESDCICNDPLSNGLVDPSEILSENEIGLINQTSTGTLRNNQVTIQYTTINNDLAYPVRCHGMVYVGNNENGISTGGRTEYNDINNVIDRIYQKYNNGYQLVYDTVSQSELEKDRILDLVYELKNGAWIRKQNMFESVYWHCGVGDESKSVFWGGIHETVGNYEIIVNDDSINVSNLNISDFQCDDSVKTFSSNEVKNYGIDYESILDGVGTCYKDPPWNDSTYVDQDKIFSDPRYKSGFDSLQYAGINTNFPEVTPLNLYPDNPQKLSEQNTSFPTSDVENDSSPNKIKIEHTYSSDEAIFKVSSLIEDSNNISTGDLKITGFVLNLTSDKDKPIGKTITSIPNRPGFPKYTFKFTDAQVYPDKTIRFNFYFKLIELDVSFLPYRVYFQQIYGGGYILFESLDYLWREGNPSPIKTYCQIFQNTNFVGGDFPYEVELDLSYIDFDLVNPSEGVMVHVKNSEQEWTAPINNCGPDLSQYIDIVADFQPIQNQKWGVPIWTQGIVNYETTPVIDFDYNYSMLEKYSVDPLGINRLIMKDEYITCKSNILSGLLNNNLLMDGTTIKEEHIFTSLRGYNITPYSGDYPDCENVYGTSNISVTVSNQSGSDSYTEWGTSFIQEYNSDPIYVVPEKWVPSNNNNIKPKTNGLSYEKTSWKRYMDGVGLGGDAPNYDTIYNKTLNEIRNVSSWQDINVWPLGQMCFGSPSSAVIVGGHKTDRNIGKNGKYNGYHASETTNRVFVWDLDVIPEEDTYNKNYLGRRLFTVFPSETEIPSASPGGQSSLNVIIFEAESDNIVEKQGTITFDGTSNSQTVTFDEEYPEGTEYSISLTPSDNVEVWWENKTTSGFELFIEINDFKGTVDYFVTATIKTTEDDIINNDPLEGYDFYK